MNHEHPGCYGLPSAVSATSPSCQECPSRGGCLFEAAQFLEQLPCNPLTKRERQSFAITQRAYASVPRGAGDTSTCKTVVASTRGLKRVALRSDEEALLRTLPERVAKQLRQLLERGWFDFAKTELRAGRNPATKGWKRVFCDAILQGQATRASLALALVQKLDLTPESARVQTSVGIAIFAAGRLATEQFGQLVFSHN